MKVFNDLVICEMYLATFWIEWGALIGVSLYIYRLLVDCFEM